MKKFCRFEKIIFVMLFKTLKVVPFLFLIILMTRCEESEGITITIGNFSGYKNIDTTSIFEVERLLFDLDDDKKIDTIIFKNLEDLKDDPQLFSIVEIKTKEDTYVIKNIDGYYIDKRTQIKIENIVNSDLALFSNTNENSSVIIIWGYQYPDCTSAINVIKFPKKKFNLEYINNNITVNTVSFVGDYNSILIEGKDFCSDENKQILIK
jgi:hypothetical protein